MQIYRSHTAMVIEIHEISVGSRYRVRAEMRVATANSSTCVHAVLDSGRPVIHRISHGVKIIDSGSCIFLTAGHLEMEATQLCKNDG